MASLVLEHPGLALQSIVLLSLMAAVNLPLPLLNKLAIDHAIPSGDRWPMISLGVLAFTVRAAASGFQVLQNHVMWNLLGGITHQLRTRMTHAILQAQTHRAGDGQLGAYVGRLSSDVESIERTIFDSFRFIVRPIAMIGVMVSVMLFVSWEVTLMILVLTPLTVFIMRSMTATLRDQNKQVLSLREDMLKTVTEQLENIRILRVNGKEEYSRRRIDEQAQRYGLAAIIYATRQQFVQGMGELLNFIPWLALVAVGAHLVHTHQLSTGDFLMFISFDQLLRSPVGQLCFYLLQLRAEMAAPERIEEVLALNNEDAVGRNEDVNTNIKNINIKNINIDTEQNINKNININININIENNIKDIKNINNAITKNIPQGSIVITHLSFAYDSNLPIFCDLNLDVKAGERVAIVGPSGAGKTTLVSLLLGFQKPSTGEILVSGIPLKPGNFKRIRQQMGVVFQHNPMFDASIRSNLMLNRTQLVEADLWDALQRADLDEFVRTLPSQLETEIGVRGLKLSGGQRQRLAIARAMLGNPQIILLDEATSSLDSVSEQQIRRALGELLRGRTSLTIAHRLSTILDSDRILYLDRGQVLESGTHSELLARKGSYSKLYELQFRGIGEESFDQA
jgi:ABC-type multidrug transport system fused ATPase/permease subunit